MGAHPVVYVHEDGFCFLDNEIWILVNGRNTRRIGNVSKRGLLGEGLGVVSGRLTSECVA
jgi:hypothetical protein